MEIKKDKGNSLQTIVESKMHFKRIIGDKEVQPSTSIEEAKQLVQNIIDNAKEKAEDEARSIVAEEEEGVKEHAKRIKAEVEAACQEKLIATGRQVCDILN